MIYTITNSVLLASPRSLALSQLLALPLSTYEEDVLNDFVQKPPHTLKFAAVAMLQDLVCVRLVQGGRYNDAIKLDHKFTSITLPKNLQLTKGRSKMVRDIYAALPSIERSMVDLELDPNTVRKAPLTPKPPSPIRKQVPAETGEAGDISLSQSWESVRVPVVVTKQATSTPLRDVRVPTSTPNFAGSSGLRASVFTPTAAPILPLNLNGIASGSKAAPRKSLPLSSSVLGLGPKPRASLSGAGSRMALGANGPAISSPVSGMRTSLLDVGAPGGHNFVSASQQQNAFYKPPPQKTNGVKRAFEEDLSHSPERVAITGHDRDVDMDGGKEKERDTNDSRNQDHAMEEERAAEVTPKNRGRRRGRISAATEEPEEEDESNFLQYSVFAAAAEERRPSPARSHNSKSGGRQKAPAPPGSFAPSEDEDAMDQDHEEPEPRKATRDRTSGKAAQHETEAAPAPPPAKKARQIKDGDLSRSIPGGFNDENEHSMGEEEVEDRVAPLRVPSPPRRGGRKLRASMSVDSVLDDGEGPQTRRRSSRLTTHGSGSVHEGSPEPAPKPKPKKTTRTTKKKKN